MYLFGKNENQKYWKSWKSPMWDPIFQTKKRFIRICIHVVSGFEQTNSIPENQSLCLSLWVSIPRIVMKSQSYMEIFYYLKQRGYNSKATGEQKTKGLKPIRQTAHGDTCERGKVWT